VTARPRALLASGNAHKLQEVREILGPGVEVEARDPGVEETGTTFEENALIKARALVAQTGEAAVAEDSGIEVDSLGGAPGVYSARWTEEGDWIPKVLRSLHEAGAVDHGRECRYVAAVAVVWPDGREVVVRGTVEGTVALAPRGTGGFGYDPIMVPLEGDGRTFAEMSEAEKHELSHRGRAFRQVREHLVGGGRAVPDVVDRLLALWVRPPTGDDADEAAFREAYADPVTLNGTDVPVGDLVERYRMLHAAFADLSIELLDRRELGDALAIVLRQRGRQVGPLATPWGPLAASGGSFDVLGIDLLTVVDGRISAIWVVADELGRLAQLGASLSGP
jgi:XTP/dITP diphosphohydrolase